MEKIQSFIIGILLSGSFSQLLAEDSIDHQINAIQKASPQERVQLMNKFKMQLADMNEEERANAIIQMQERMQGHPKRSSKEISMEKQQNKLQLYQAGQIQKMNTMQQQNMRQLQNIPLQREMQGNRH